MCSETHQSQNLFVTASGIIKCFANRQATGIKLEGVSAGESTVAIAPIKPDTTLCVPDVTFDLTAQLTVVKSAMGTSKTKQLAKLLAETDKPAILITFRRTFA